MEIFFAYLFRLIPAVIMGQTLYFKLSGAEESVYIFSVLGVEPWGRYVSAVSELIAVVAILYNRTVFYGAVLSIGIMIGAVIGHVFFLGIEVQNDNGMLFIMLSAVLICSIYVAYLYRDQCRFKWSKPDTSNF